jgi:hypothetical protein
MWSAQRGDIDSLKRMRLALTAFFLVYPSAASNTAPEVTLLICVVPKRTTATVSHLRHMPRVPFRLAAFSRIAATRASPSRDAMDAVVVKRDARNKPCSEIFGRRDLPRDNRHYRPHRV